jgi:hypothetical protein
LEPASISRFGRDEPTRLVRRSGREVDGVWSRRASGAGRWRVRTRWRGVLRVGAGVIHALGELLEADGGGAEGAGAVTAHFRNDFVVEEADETMKFFLGTLGGILQPLI